MKMRKVIAMVLAGAMTLSMAACGGSSTSSNATSTGTPAVSNNASTTEGKDATTTTPATGVVKIQVGYENATSEPAAKAVEKWAELVKEKSNGAMELELFPNSALGKKTELIDQMILGEPMITVADGAFLADYGVADFGIFYAPFMFESWEEVWSVLDSDWYKGMCDELAEKANVRVLTSNWIYGARDILSVKKIVTPQDLKGLKLRVSSNELSISSFESLGASAVGMDLGEVYQALQAKTIDAVENPITSLANKSFHEVAKYLVKDNHILATSMWICGESFYQTLTPEQQKLLMDAAYEAGLFNNELQDESLAVATKILEDAGVEITELTKEQKEMWIEAGLPFYDKATGTLGWSEGLYNTVREAIEK